MTKNPQHYLFTEKYRPTTLEGYIGNPIFRADLEKWIQDGQIPNIILSGIAGTGKTTAAKLITENIDCDALYINASDENGIDTIREKVKTFASAASFKPLKIIILDEADYLTVNAQSALRNIIETFSLTTRFILTCNYFERIADPIKSRLERYELNPPTKGELAKKCVEILTNENIKFEKNDIALLINQTYPDNRQTLIKLQSFSKTGKLIITSIQSQINKVSDSLIQALKNKKFGDIRKIVIDLDLKDYTELYQLLSDRLDEYTSDVITAWKIAESLHQSVSSPNKQITFLGLCSRIINN
jgi:DNA polymerase III delta prime subunit